MTLPTIYRRVYALAALFAGIGLIAGCASPKPAPARIAPAEIKLSAESAKSPFVGYDREVVLGIQARWYELIEESGRKLKPDIRGTVVVEFHLMEDGQVKNLQVVKSTVDKLPALLCQKAVLDASPFPRWPGEMARMVNAPHREIRFTFYYE